MTKSSLYSAVIKKPKAILFDWDNTISRPSDTNFDALREILYKYDISSSRIDEILQGHKSVKEILIEEYDGDMNILEKIRQEYDRLAIHREQGIILFDGLIELLETLVQAKIFLGIVSNKLGYSLRKEVTKAKLNSYFDIVIGSGDAEFDKPNAAPLKLALEGTEITAEDVLFIGDTAGDLIASNNFGSQAILFTGNNNISNAEIEQYRPFRIYDSYYKMRSSFKFL